MKILTVDVDIFDKDQEKINYRGLPVQVLSVNLDIQRTHSSLLQLLKSKTPFILNL